MSSWLKKWVCVGVATGLAFVSGCRNYSPAEPRQGWEMLGQAAGNPSGGVGAGPETGGGSYRYSTARRSTAPNGAGTGGTSIGTGGSGR